MNKGYAQLENNIVKEHNFLTGFTLLELIIVVVIVGILAAISLPKFGVTKERALDKEAKANLALIQAAEKIYRMETGIYYPNDGSTANVTGINTNLRVSLPTSASSWWYYAYGDKTTAVRSDSSRTWTLTYTDTGGIATCSGTGCPPY
ncbi:MAG: prepilin-type N-terminal cleavage/methylation domain-containing protein [Candidatus Omnitrophota bacterium]|nr:prepilin-type N-terminal cleavage/methylation domain-containing protein [Candidatus Omnitrophota bacterium]